MSGQTRFKCAVCGKLTAGKIPLPAGGYHADKSERWPRMHRLAEGKPCPGVYVFAEWVDVEDPRP